MAKDYYQILGLQKGATVDEVKKAYRRLSKELHPDKHKGDKSAEQRFKEVNEAYEVLGDAEKKRRYDQFGSVGGSGFEGFSGFGNGDLSGFADIFESFFGGGGSRAKPSTRGEDIEVKIAVDLQEMIADAERGITLTKMRPCAECGGSGVAQGSRKIRCVDCDGTGQITRQQQSFFGTIAQRFVCPRCAGSGEVPETPCAACSSAGRKEEKATVQIRVPAGIEDGQTLRIRGEGNAGKQGGEAGDMYVHVTVRPDKRFTRQGADIRSEASVHVRDAILGTQIHIETLHGPVELKVPEGTQPEQVFRLKGKGMPVAGSSRTGDHYVTLHMEVPKKLSRAERKLLEEWAALR